MRGDQQLKIGNHYTQTVKNPKSFDGSKWTHDVEQRDVVLLAVSGVYAMVRRPGCMPYVCTIKDLS